jgi:hypothetical protein
MNEKNMKHALRNTNLGCVKLNSLLQLAVFAIPHMYNAAFANRNQMVAQTKQENNLRVVLFHFEFDAPPVPRVYVTSNGGEGEVATCSKSTNFLGESVR